MNIFFETLLAVSVVSLISLIGAVFLVFGETKLKKMLKYMVGFSTGAIFGDVFIHLLPEIVKTNGLTINISLFILLGIVLGFVTEKIICWHHCHVPVSSHHIHSFALMNIVGDIFHNFLDGVVIAASFLVSPEVGLATTTAVVFHEIPHEIGNFGILLHGGFSKQKALFYNFLTACVSIIGAILTLIFSNFIGSAAIFLSALAAGNFIYIAGSDLIPELHKDEDTKNGIIQLFFILAGIGVMFLFLGLEK
jgi:zinc and cadmium transporter